MKAANLAGAVLGAILKVVFVVIVVYMVYTGVSKCYDYGYRIFTEPAVSSGEGRKVTVTLTSDMSATEIGTDYAGKRAGKRCEIVCITVSAVRIQKRVEARYL